MITTNNLSKSYGDIRAVQNVNFEIKKGEIVGLLGRNGAGKTTIMKMITGFLDPSEGSVALEDKTVVDNRIAVQTKIGYMPENAPLYPEMIVQDYLLMIANLRGIPAEKQIPAILEAVKATGLDSFLTRTIGTLSKGYRQRVGICQAIVHKPEVLILDEPTNGLDPVQIVEIRNLIKHLAKRSTVILSTHILQEIEAVCDRVLILIDGQLVKDAPLHDFLTSSRIHISVEDRVTEKEMKSLADAISSIDGFQKEGPPTRAGFTPWSIAWQGELAPIPEILQFAGKLGWQVAGASTSSATLEKAFSDLMLEHANRDKKQDREEDAA